MTAYTYTATGGIQFERNANDAPQSAVCAMSFNFTPGLVTGPVQALANVVAGSTTFQTWTGSTSQALALNNVIIQAAKTFTRPFAWISVPSGALQTDLIKGAFNSGSLKLAFEWNVPVDLDANPNEAFYSFMGTVENIVVDMWNQVGVGSSGQLLIRSIEMTTPPEYSSWSETPYLYCQFDVKFGAL